MKRYALATFVAIGTFASTDATAALVEYQFTGSTLSPTTVDPEVGAANTTPISIGSGLTQDASSSWFGTSSGNTFLKFTGAGGTAGADSEVGKASYNPATGDYVQFTLTPPSEGLDLDGISLKFTSTGTTTGTGSRRVRVEYSFDGFATRTQLPVSDNIATANTFQTYSASLTDQNPLLQTTTSPIVFRVTAATGNDLRLIMLDDIAVTGSVVPEPTALGALAFAGLALGGRRRR